MFCASLCMLMFNICSVFVSDVPRILTVVLAWVVRTEFASASPDFVRSRAI